MTLKVKLNRLRKCVDLTLIGNVMVRTAPGQGTSNIPFETYDIATEYFNSAVRMYLQSGFKLDIIKP